MLLDVVAIVVALAALTIDVDVTHGQDENGYAHSVLVFLAHEAAER